MRDFQLVIKLPYIYDANTSKILYSLLCVLLESKPRYMDLLFFDQYIAAKIPLSTTSSEKQVKFLPDQKDIHAAIKDSTDQRQKDAIKNILLRNRSLRSLHPLLFTSKNTVNNHLCEDISRILGLDWILLLLQPQIHAATVILGMRILVVVCASDGFQNGGYLKFTEQVSQSGGLVFTSQISPQPTSSGSIVQVQHGCQLPAQIASEVKTAVLRIPGFQYLEWLLPHHLDVPELYFLLTAHIMGQPVKVLGTDHSKSKLDLDRIWAFLWGSSVSQSPSPKVHLCSEGVCVLLSMIRHIVHEFDCQLDWLVSHPVTIIHVPMGAQSIERLEQFQKRFKEWDDRHGETLPYHYGIHYSSAMIVCSYLIRMEPFTQHFLPLQGGHFDLADPMFHSVKKTWLSASKFNMTDVKELIPDFFYLPEFLQNSNNFNLGSKQNGDTLNHVILPPWAKQDVREFIRVHRQAVECDYVSQNLHQWICFIFGCRQQGNAAVDAVNVFHHLFYESNVDIYNTDDPLKKNTTIGFINNFGQISKKSHPYKKMSSIIDANPLLSSTLTQHDKLFFYNLDSLKPSLKELKEAVGQIIHPDKTVLSVDQNKVLMAPTFSRYIAWGFADHSLRIGMYDSDRALFVSEASGQSSGEILACACPHARTIVTVWEFDVRRKSLTTDRSLYGHIVAVTSLVANTPYNSIVLGSRDGMAHTMDMFRFTFARLLSDNVGLVGVSIIDLTGRNEILEIVIANMSKRGSLTSAKSLHELMRKPLVDKSSGNPDMKDDSGEAINTGDDVPITSKCNRASISETSIIDSFIVVEYARITRMLYVKTSCGIAICILFLCKRIYSGASSNARIRLRQPNFHQL